MSAVLLQNDVVIHWCLQDACETLGHASCISSFQQAQIFCSSSRPRMASISNWRWTLNIVSICDHPFHRHWLSTASVFPPSVTGHFLFLHVPGTVCLSTAPQNPQNQSSELLWRPISSHCRFPYYCCEVPSQWLIVLDTSIRSCIHSSRLSLGLHCFCRFYSAI